MSMLSEESAILALENVVDPEVGINVVDLGLVYRIDVTGTRVEVDMTMTTASCPLGPQLKADAENAIRRHLPDAESVTVNLVWDPPWTSDRMSPRARSQLGWPSEG